MFDEIQKDIFISAYATYILNLVDVAIEDGTYDPALYGFTLEAITLLNQKIDPEIITNIFEVQLLERFGISINWKRCCICGETHGKFDYSFANHGILCEKHWHLDERRSHFDAVGMHFIRLFSQISYKQINEITLKKETKDMIRFILDEIYSEYVGIFLKSKKFIDDMKSWENVMKKDDSSSKD
jgi:DNA repair protein RecO (recombination protein O)